MATLDLEILRERLHLLQKEHMRSSDQFRKCKITGETGEWEHNTLRSRGMGSAISAK